MDVLKKAQKAVTQYVFTEWYDGGIAEKRRKAVAEYRRIEHLDDPTYYDRNKTIKR
tara:strand:+ start:481 stop:648 length:168 start_codon:yes stop_codon:yes gene_type:complete